MTKTYFLIITIVLVSLASALAQTTILITNGTSVIVPIGAEICADFITVQAGGSYLPANPSGTCAGAIVTDVIEEELIPTEFALHQNYPNPFNPGTKISWESPIGSMQVLKVYDVLGNEIVTLVEEYKPAGNYEVEFSGSKLSGGVYLYQLKSGEFVSTRKMILLK